MTCNDCGKPVSEHKRTKLGKPRCPTVNKREMVSCELPEGVRERVKAKSATTGIPVSHIMRDALARWAED